MLFVKEKVFIEFCPFVDFGIEGTAIKYMPLEFIVFEEQYYDTIISGEKE